MKPKRMIYVGGTCEGVVEAGKSYLVIGKTKESLPDGRSWYCYLFNNDQGIIDSAASWLFVAHKPKFGAKK